MSEIIAGGQGALGLITLNRPKALNSLTTQMCADMSAALRAFEQDQNIKHVAVRSGEPGRFFCAGGDIRTLQAQIKQGVYDEAEAFFSTEYRLNRQIARYSKPYIALIDGMVMGGGVGISGHGTFRVVTDNTVFAMPEVAIGFFPDVGASRLLAQLPSKMGAYLAITGERIKAADMLYLGLATHHVAPASFEDIIKAMAEGEDAKTQLDRSILAPAAVPLAETKQKIANYFGSLDLHQIHALLIAEKSGFAEKCLSTITARSPTSMAIALKQLQAGVLDIDETLKRDFRLACHIIRGHDFPEGVRALLIDKDQKPVWKPARIEDINEDDIAAYFAPLPEDKELSFSR
jgi:enoyl-CoA hydratase